LKQKVTPRAVAFLLIKMSFSSARVLLKNADALWAAASMEAFDTGSLAARASVPRSAARLLIKNLMGCELVKKVRGGYRFIGRKLDESIIFNFRDEMLDPLFRRRVARELFMRLARGERNLKRIAEDVDCTRMTVIRALKDLRLAGLVDKKNVALDVCLQPSDQTELIPRTIHREAVRYFLDCFKAHSAHVCPVILFGKAASGRWSSPLKLAGLLRFASPEVAAPTIEALTRAAEETIREYGVATSLFLVMEDAWFAQKFSIVKVAHPLLLDVLNGIFVLGKPPKDEEYFQLIRQSYRMPREKLERMLRRGYIKPYCGDFAFTEKGLRVWRKAPVNIVEFEYPCNGKKIPIISVGAVKAGTP